MKQSDAYTMIIREYLSKCKCCDECFAESYCIKNNLRKSRYPQVDCADKIKEYLRLKK